MEQITDQYQIRLSRHDRRQLRATHRAFFRRQLLTKFELQKSGRVYPGLGELFAMATPDGQQRSFLASEQLFKRVQRLQRRNRVIPVIGDFAGNHALRAIARELQARKLAVSVFYASNVEQYIITPPTWRNWVRNLEALPARPGALLVRCYLEQGRPHPRQMKGHRTTTVLQQLGRFLQ